MKKHQGKIKIEITLLGEDKIEVKSDMPVLITKREMKAVKQAIAWLLQ